MSKLNHPWVAIARGLVDRASDCGPSVPGLIPLDIAVDFLFLV